MSEVPSSGQNQFLLYTAPDGAVKVDVFFKDETVWLTQKAMAELFGVKRPGDHEALAEHLLNRGIGARIQYVPFWNILPADGKTYSGKVL